MPKIHVLLKKEELDQQRLPGKTVIVLDILFATTSIVTALAEGAAEIVPFVSGDAALAESQKRERASYVLSGELNAETLAGFCHPTPLALLNEQLAGRSVLYCTTNGTVALAKAAEADHVYAAALVNGRAAVERILRDHGEETVLIVCSGSVDNFNLEDFYGAGHLVALFHELAPEHYEYTDAAHAARLLFERTEAMECLGQARVGRMMLSRDLEDEVRFAAEQDRFNVVVKLVGGVLCPV